MNLSEEMTEKAIAYCDTFIDFYTKQKNRMRIRDNATQTAIILGTGATSFAAAAAGTGNWSPWVVALPAVITAIASGFNVVFRFRAKYVNCAITAARLKSERLRFQIRTADGNAKLEDFVDRIDAIVNEELAEFRDLHREPSLTPSPQDKVAPRAN